MASNKKQTKISSNEKEKSMKKPNPPPLVPKVPKPKSLPPLTSLDDESSYYDDSSYPPSPIYYESASTDGSSDEPYEPLDEDKSDSDMPLLLGKDARHSWMKKGEMSKKKDWEAGERKKKKK